MNKAQRFKTGLCLLILWAITAPTIMLLIPWEKLPHKREISGSSERTINSHTSINTITDNSLGEQKPIPRTHDADLDINVLGAAFEQKQNYFIKCQPQVLGPGRMNQTEHHF